MKYNYELIENNLFTELTSYKDLGTQFSNELQNLIEINFKNTDRLKFELILKLLELS